MLEAQVGAELGYEHQALADRIAVLDNGRLEQLDTPSALYHQPANEMVASFISQGIVLPVEIISKEVDGYCEALLFGQPLRLRCRAGDRPRPNAKVCCRSENVTVVSSEKPGFDGIINNSYILYIFFIVEGQKA